MVFASCFHAVVPVAKCLPVGFVPEQPVIATVWYNVVDIRGLHVPPFLHALHAQGMRFQVPLPCLLPPAAVAASGCSPCLLWVEGLVLLTILVPVWNKFRTPRMPAWCVRSIWQKNLSLLELKPFLSYT